MTCVRFDRPSTTSFEDRSSLLAAFEGALTRSGENAALACLAETAPPTLGLDVIIAYQADDARRILTLSFGHGMEMRTYHALGSLAYGEFLFGRVARDRRVAVVADIGESTDPACAAGKKLGMHAYVGAPLLGEEAGLHGIVCFGSRKHTRFREADVELFTTMAQRLAAARGLA